MTAVFPYIQYSFYLPHMSLHTSASVFRKSRAQANTGRDLKVLHSFYQLNVLKDVPIPPLQAGAPIAQLGERRTLDRKVTGSILNRGAVLCP